MKRTLTAKYRPVLHFPQVTVSVPDIRKASATSVRQESLDRLVFVDVLRGLAILAVIGVHARYAFADMPFLARYVGSLGRYGVDLFFVVSAFTLFRSNQTFSLRVFLLRRWLRIAPIYYLGILLYTGVPAMSSTEANPGFVAIAANVVFLNAWIPGVANDVVPGGWSISSEVAFYVLLPLAIPFVTTLRRAVTTFVGTLIVSQFLLAGVSLAMASNLSAEQLKEYLAYCPLEHLGTFSLGIILYHLLPILRARLELSESSGLSLTLMVLGGLLLFLLNVGNLPGLLPRPITGGIPAFVFAIGVAIGLGSIQSRPIALLRWIGVISYGIYLIHFFVLDVAEGIVVALMPVQSPGIVLFGMTFLVTAVLSAAGAAAVHRYVETPALRLGPGGHLRLAVAA